MMPVSEGTIFDTLKSFKRDKSPGLDGWIVEFYLSFFDLMGNALTEVVEETRCFGIVPEALNKTYITLIPKVDKPFGFNEYKPIALCNLLYKLISKIIADRLKPVLSKVISEEQFGFLQGRQIHDVVELVQESLHSVKQKRLCAFILKLDLEKSYNRIIWGYLRLLLTQVGLSYDISRSIMLCVSTASFMVLVNGSPTPFFKSGGGIR